VGSVEGSGETVPLASGEVVSVASVVVTGASVLAVIFRSAVFSAGTRFALELNCKFSVPVMDWVESEATSALLTWLPSIYTSAVIRWAVLSVRDVITPEVILFPIVIPPV
jgi:hypothetical protein